MAEIVGNFGLSPASTRLGGQAIEISLHRDMLGIAAARPHAALDLPPPFARAADICARMIARDVWFA